MSINPKFGKLEKSFDKCFILNGFAITVRLGNVNLSFKMLSVGSSLKSGSMSAIIPYFEFEFEFIKSKSEWQPKAELYRVRIYDKKTNLWIYGNIRH